MRATKRHVAVALVFVALFFGPLFLIPAFPEIWQIQLLRTSAGGLSLFAFALAITLLVDRFLLSRVFRGESGQPMSLGAQSRGGTSQDPNK